MAESNQHMANEKVEQRWFRNGVFVRPGKTKRHDEKRIRKMQMKNSKSPALVRLKQEAQAGCRKGVRHPMNG